MDQAVTAPRRAALFDRDGVLNVDLGYTHRPEDLVLMPGAANAVRRLNEAGYLVLVVTNQSGVALGFYDEAAVNGFHAAINEALAKAGARIDAFYSCPFHAEATVERYRHPDHPDRKPNPGMIVRALAEQGVAAENAFLIGDRDSDLDAARRAGVEGHLYEGGDLDALVEAILAATR